MSGMTVAAFFPDSDEEIVRVHGAHCTHLTRDWRKHGRPVMMYVQSHAGVARQMRSQGIRFKGVRIMPCAQIPEGFWSYTPEGERLKLHATEQGAKVLTRRIRKLNESLPQFRITDVSPWLKERYGIKPLKAVS